MRIAGPSVQHRVIMYIKLIRDHDTKHHKLHVNCMAVAITMVCFSATKDFCIRPGDTSGIAATDISSDWRSFAFRGAHGGMASAPLTGLCENDAHVWCKFSEVKTVAFQKFKHVCQLFLVVPTSHPLHYLVQIRN